MLEAKSIIKSYGSTKVLQGITLNVNAGEVVVILGASGAGKSTLLNILGTLDNFDAGSLSIAGVDISLMNDKQLAIFRNQNIGFVFQMHHLLPEFNLLENVAMPGYIAGKPSSSVDEDAKSILAELNLSDRLTHLPEQLSGGELQRAAVARALINNPAIILADEPSGSLDSTNAMALYKLILSLRKKFNQTFILATHDMKLASMADRKYVIQDGKFLGSVP